jgi:RNase adapter protein RapZ
MQLVLITGLSGSGKSVALGVLEDSGYYCVDNLPVNLLPELFRYLGSTKHARVALSMDVRGGEALSQLPLHLAELRGNGADVRIIYLDAKNDTLIKRFSETRRRHPLSDGRRTLPECIALERQLLEGLSSLGHHVDTSELSPHSLRSWVKDLIELTGAGLTLLIQSFAFKHGVPLDADLVFDVRCVTNPHYDPQLRPLTGRDAPVVAFLQADGSAAKMAVDIERFLTDWLPCYNRDNRSYLTVAIGCTGGRHRSVYFSEFLQQRFTPQWRVLVRHRELALAEA